MMGPNQPCQLSLWEETGVLGENPRLSAERWHEGWVRVHIKMNLIGDRTQTLKGERQEF